MNEYQTAGRINFQNDRGYGWQQGLSPICIPYHIDIIRARLKDLYKFTEQIAALVYNGKSKKFVLVELAFRQRRHIRRLDIYPLITKLSHSLWRFHTFELDQHAFGMRARADKSHRLMLFTQKELPATFQPLREVRMQVQYDLSLHAMRTTKKTHRQIDRLAVWRA